LTGSPDGGDPVAPAMNVLIYFTLLALISVYALSCGGEDERRGIAVCLAASLATRLLLSPLTDRFEGLELSVALVDLLALLAFIAIALRSSRFWPLWVAGLQLTSSMGHLLKLAEPGLIPVAYATALAFWSYPILLIIAIGVFRAPRYRQPNPLV
jgi:hypothetical protein